MAKRPANNPSPVVVGNSTVTTGPCRPEDYYSRANCFPAGYQSLLQANAQARLAEKDQHHAMQHGAPYVYDQKQHEIRHRYNRQFVKPGRATYNKCCDDIV